MSIRIGLYDFFAYTIPGSFYIASIGFAGLILGVYNLSEAGQFLLSISATHFVVLALVAYIVGLIMDPIAKAWYRLFKPKNLSKVVLDEYKKLHPEINFKFDADEWPIVLSYIRHKNDEIAYDINRFNATNIMLRNVSFAFAVLTIITLVNLVRGGFNIWYLLSIIIFAIFSLISGRESVKYARWFYGAQYIAVIVDGMEGTDLATRKPSKTKSKT